jgi:threonine dehydrogenase-like Zn-dependent dehydrogenase
VVKDLTGGLGAERVIVPVAARSAFQNAIAVSAKASTIVFFGLPGEKDTIEIPALQTLTGDKTVLFSWLAPYTWNTAMKALSSGKVQFKPLITNTFPLEKTKEGIEFMHSSVVEKIKGMILVG